MKNFYFLVFILLNYLPLYSQWINLNSGINDNLTGIVFLQNNGLASGENGLYFTTNGGIGATSWTRFEITDNNANSNIYEHTKFTHCYSKPSNLLSTGTVFACGQNTLNNTAVLMKITLPSMLYEIIYIGTPNSKLNKIEYSINDDRFYSVGNNGLVLSFTNLDLKNFTSSINDDLTAITFYPWIYTIAVASANGKLFEFGFNYNNNTLVGLRTVLTPLCQNLDVYSNSNQTVDSVGFDVDQSCYFGSTPNITFNKNYFSPLNAKCIFKNFVGTDNGVFKRVYNNNILSLELQPSATNYSINRFFQNVNSELYACGNNGTILKTVDGGGATKPYVKIYDTINCINTASQFNAIIGSGTIAKWYSDGQLIHNGINGFSYVYNIAGQHNISLVVINAAGESTTINKTINIVNLPLINKTVSINDNILCKIETVTIQVNDSEPNVVYTLKNDNFPNIDFGTSNPSTGGNLVFISNNIDVSGNYYLYAKNELSNCGRRFTDNILITVEETKADFHSGLINAQINENVDFYNNSIDSQNFDWQFSLNSQVQNSSLPNPQINFSSIGTTNVLLHSWSNNNCNDTTMKAGPVIYQLPAIQNDCFMLHNKGPDHVNEGIFFPDIYEMNPTTDGFLTCGKFNKNIFDSKFGTIIEMQNKRGGFATKYDINGVLKWIVYIANPNLPDARAGIINSAVEDLDGNIYISGNANIGSVFYDNSGKKISFSNYYFDVSFIIKLNSKGEFSNMFNANSPTSVATLPFLSLAIDNQNNLIALSDKATSGLDIYNISKFSPQGNLIWQSEIRDYSINRSSDTKLKVDSDNNIYFGVNFEYSLECYSANNTTPIIIGNINNKTNFAVIKFDQNGIFVWKINSKSTSNNNLDNVYDSTRINDFIVESDGTLYLTGYNNFSNNFGATNFNQVFEDADGTITPINNRPFLIVKFNNSGSCQWIRTATPQNSNSQYGLPEKLLKAGNEIYVVGDEVDNSIFDSADNNNYLLTQNFSDYFIAIYDELGNLKRLISSGNNNIQYGFDKQFVGFFKGQGNYFYIAKNMYSGNGLINHSDFGSIIPPLDGTDGTIIRFTENCGILKYDSLNLGNIFLTNDFINDIFITPNPTSSIINVSSKLEIKSIELYDIQGRILETVLNANSIDISDKSNGIYFLKITTDIGSKIEKVVKE